MFKDKYISNRVLCSKLVKYINRIVNAITPKRIVSNLDSIIYYQENVEYGKLYKQIKSNYDNIFNYKQNKW